MFTRTRPDLSAQAKYPEFTYAADAETRELRDGARVWKHFNDEAGRYDYELVERWKDTINILLVFAGLFSAVVTAFVVDTSSKIEPDYASIQAALLLELVNANRNANGIAPITHDDNIFASFPVSRRVSTAHVFMHGLWYTSLTLSLLVAVTCVLVGQWLSSYLSSSSAPPEDVAKTRQFRFRGIKTWGVGFIIGSLPFLLILALFLFLGGLVIFLFSYGQPIATFIAILSGTAFCLYLISAGLPAFYIACPYRTSLSAATFWLRCCMTRLVSTAEPNSLDFAQQEQEVVTKLAHLGGDCLFWMFDHTQSPVIDMIVVQALAGLCPDINTAVKTEFRHYDSPKEAYYFKIMFRPLRNRKMFAWSLMNSIESWCWNIPDVESSEFMSALTRGIIIRVSKTILYLCFLPSDLRLFGKHSQYLLPNTYSGWGARKKKFCACVLDQLLPKFWAWKERRFPSADNASATDVDRSRCTQLGEVLEILTTEVMKMAIRLESLPESPTLRPRRSRRDTLSQCSRDSNFSVPCLISLLPRRSSSTSSADRSADRLDLPSLRTPIPSISAAMSPVADNSQPMVRYYAPRAPGDDEERNMPAASDI